MRWNLEWRPRALSDLAGLDPQIRQRVGDAIERLAEDGRREGLRKLQGRDAEWRMRVGDWRIRLRFDYSGNILTVLRVQHRREVYRSS